MSKRVTITDIAKQTGVSAGTVHRALTGKPGVSESVRLKIVAAAKRSGYKPNYVASSLKRKKLRIVASFPGLTESNRYFYSFVWQGYRDYAKEVGDYNLELIELPFFEGDAGQAAELDSMLDRYPEGIDGLVTVGPIDRRAAPALMRCSERGIPIALACDDSEGLDRIGCVLVDHDVTGRMMAEQVFSQIGGDGTVVLLAGDMLVPAHYGVVKGFEAYMADKGIRNEVVKVYGYLNKEDLRIRTAEAFLRTREFAAACCVCARGTVIMAEALRETGFAGKVRAIGSDVFDVNGRSLRDGTLTNLVYKDPYGQAYRAARILLNFLIKGERPLPDTQYVESVMVFRSNLEQYESGSYRGNL